MSLSTNLREYVSACFTGLWIESHEHPDALAEIAQLCRDENWRLAVWDIDRGLQIPGQDNTETGGDDPLAAIRSVNALASPDSSALLVLQNFHKFLSSPEVIQAVARQVIDGRQNRTFLIVLSPVVSLPVEIEKLFTVLEHEMPTREQLEEIARGVATEDGELPNGANLQAVLDASMGLTRMEAENAYSLSLVRNGRVTPEAVWTIKTGALKKTGVVGLHRGSERFEQLGRPGKPQSILPEGHAPAGWPRSAAPAQLSSGIVEGFNNKLKLITRKSYGFRTQEAYETALYHNLGALPERKFTHEFS